MSNSAKIVETKSLCKSYGEHLVLHDLNLSIERGQLVGFLGPNGAGKSTTIRILLGLLWPTSGSTKIFGMPLETSGKQIRARLGYLPGDVHHYSNYTAAAFLKFFAAARGQSCMDEANRLAEVLDLSLHKRIRQFSTGMRQKLGLIQALMHQPEFLILDEPTSALDPLVRVAVFDELKKVTEQGRTVLFSSHSLDEVESLCDEVIILRSGRIVEQQKIDELKDRALRKIQIVFSGSVGHAETPAELKVFDHSENRITGTWSGDIKPLLGWLETQEIEDVMIERPDLNDLFISYYSESDGSKT